MGNYGICPLCGADGVNAERSPNGSTTCANGHRYPHGSRVYPACEPLVMDSKPAPAPMPEDNPIMEVRFCWNCGAAISEFDRECCECGDCGFGLAVYPYAKQTKEYHALTRRLAEVEGECDEAQAGAHAEQEVSRAWRERAEAAEARVGELDFALDAWGVWHELERFPPPYQANRRVWDRHNNACDEIEDTLKAALAAVEG